MASLRLQGAVRHARLYDLRCGRSNAGTIVMNENPGGWDIRWTDRRGRHHTWVRGSLRKALAEVRRIAQHVPCGG